MNDINRVFIPIHVGSRNNLVKKCRDYCNESFGLVYGEDYRWHFLRKESVLLRNNQNAEKCDYLVFEFKDQEIATSFSLKFC